MTAPAAADLDADVLWLTGLVTGRYAPAGIPIERADCRSGHVVHDRFILDELGDFLPNVAAVTVFLGPPAPLRWAVDLAAGTRQARYRRGGLLEPFAFASRRWRRVQGLSLAWPYWNLDTLTGLVALWEILRDAGRAGEADELGADVEAFARALLSGGLRDGHLRYAFHPATRLALPLSSPQLTGYVAEELLRYGRLAGAGWSVEAGLSLLREECATPSFERTGLFRAEVHGPAAPLLRAGLGLLGKRHFARPMLMKDNTLPAFALLAASAVAREPAAWALAAADRWRAAVDRHFRLPSGFLATYALGAGQPPPRPGLTYNHSLIEWDIERHVASGGTAALEGAIDLAARWAALQTPRGLFPEGPEGPPARRALLDSQVDLSMDLLKLAELTGEDRWRGAALRNLAAVRRDFRLPFGYAWAVDPTSGAVRHPVVEVKYLGLLLKGLLGLRAFLEGRSLRRSPLLWMLLRDR